METIVITRERMEEVLPQNIKESDVISENAKKVLASLLNYQFTNEKAIEAGFVAIPTKILAQSVTLQKSKALGAIQELVDHQLIVRRVGKSRTIGETALASEYTIQFENLNKPLKKITFQDLYAQFLKSSGIPSGTPNPNTNTDSNTYAKAEAYTEALANTNTESDTKTDIYSNLPF
jgi:hypothetical protein